MERVYPRGGTHGLIAAKADGLFKERLSQKTNTKA